MLLDALDRLADALEAVVDRIGRVMAWLVLAVVFLLFVQNPLREYLGRGQFFANDMGQLSHAAVFMIGVAYAWRWDRQVRMDLFYRSMSPRTKAVVNLLGTVFLLLPWLAFVTWDAVPTVIDSVRIARAFSRDRIARILRVQVDSPRVRRHDEPAGHRGHRALDRRHPGSGARPGMSWNSCASTSAC